MGKKAPRKNWHLTFLCTTIPLQEPPSGKSDSLCFSGRAFQSSVLLSTVGTPAGRHSCPAKAPWGYLLQGQENAVEGVGREGGPLGSSGECV